MCYLCDCKTIECYHKPSVNWELLSWKELLNTFRYHYIDESHTCRYMSPIFLYYICQVFHTIGLINEFQRIWYTFCQLSKSRLIAKYQTPLKILWRILKTKTLYCILFESEIETETSCLMNTLTTTYPTKHMKTYFFFFL